MIDWGASPVHSLCRGRVVVWTGGSVPRVFTRGGTYRRALWSWTRTAARRQAQWARSGRWYARGRVAARVRGQWGRTARRELPAWNRVARWDTNQMSQITPHTFTKTASDDRTFGFDYSDAPEVWDGAAVVSAVSSGTVSGGSGLTFGTPAALATAFDDIPAQAGLSCRISGGTAGTTYKFAMIATLASGRVLTIPCRMVVVADVPA